MCKGLPLALYVILKKNIMNRKEYKKNVESGKVNPYEVNVGKSITVPNQTMSIREIVARYVQTGEMPQGHNVYHDSEVLNREVDTNDYNEVNNRDFDLADYSRQEAELKIREIERQMQQGSEADEANEAVNNLVENVQKEVEKPSKAEKSDA